MKQIQKQIETVLETDAQETHPSLFEEIIQQSCEMNEARVEREGSSFLGPNDLVVADVVEIDVSGATGRISVRWTDENQQVEERRLQAVRGLVVAAGDQVIVSRPSNWSEPIITDVLSVEKKEVVATFPGLENPTVSVKLDGRRIEIDGKDEIVLRCGESCIILRRNGHVVIRGVEIETRAKGANRIKGGSVSIN